VVRIWGLSARVLARGGGGGGGRGCVVPRLSSAPSAGGGDSDRDYARTLAAAVAITPAPLV
jgi:hypothetical protein